VRYLRVRRYFNFGDGGLTKELLPVGDTKRPAATTQSATVR
jgi:hypothetical protein